MGDCSSFYVWHVRGQTDRGQTKMPCSVGQERRVGRGAQKSRQSVTKTARPVAPCRHSERRRCLQGCLQGCLQRSARHCGGGDSRPTRNRPAPHATCRRLPCSRVPSRRGLWIQPAQTRLPGHGQAVQSPPWSQLCELQPLSQQSRRAVADRPHSRCPSSMQPGPAVLPACLNPTDNLVSAVGRAEGT